MRMCADGANPSKTTDSPIGDKMEIDVTLHEEDGQVDDEVHMTDVTPTHPNSKFVIDDEESDEEEPTIVKQQRKQVTMLTEALTYGQHLQEDYRDDPREEVRLVLREAFSLLAYTDPRVSVVGHLLEESSRLEVAEELNSAILGILYRPAGADDSVDGQEFNGTLGKGCAACIYFGQRTS